VGCRGRSWENRGERCSAPVGNSVGTLSDLLDRTQYRWDTLGYVGFFTVYYKDIGEFQILYSQDIPYL
jgi:hypothetical protein